MPKAPVNPPLDSLVDLACRDGVDIRPTLLRVLTDLYVQKPAHSTAEETQYVELTLGLIEAVDAPTRAAITARLSAYPAAPAAILAKLGGTPPQPAPHIGAHIENKAKPKNDLIELFFAANSEERRLILTNLNATADMPAHRPARASDELIRRLEQAALQRNTGEFGRMLERTLGIEWKLAERIVHDPSGEPVVVAARALGMTGAVLQRILLFLNPTVGQSVERVYDLARLYDDLTPTAAERMLAIWRQSSTGSQTAHAPFYWDDERRDARSLSTPARYRSDRGRIEQPSRVRARDQR